MKKRIITISLAGILALSTAAPALARSPNGNLINEWHVQIIVGRTTQVATGQPVTLGIFMTELRKITNFAKKILELVQSGAGLTAKDVKMAYSMLGTHESYINRYAQYATDADSVAALMKARAAIAEAKGALLGYWTDVLKLKEGDLVKAAEDMSKKEEYAPFVEERRK